MRTVCFFCLVFFLFLTKKKEEEDFISSSNSLHVAFSMIHFLVLFYSLFIYSLLVRWPVGKIHISSIYLVYLSHIKCCVLYSFGLLSPNFRSFYSDTQTWVNAWTKVLITCATVSALCWHTNHQHGTWCFLQLRKSKNLKMCQKIKVCL